MAIADMEPGSEYQIEYGNDEKIKEEMAAKMTEKLDMALQVISRLVQKLQRMQAQELSVLHLMLRNNFTGLKTL